MEQIKRLAAPGSSRLTASDVLTLLDWKRTIFGLYADVRASSDAEAAWQRWRDVREHLIRTHPQSPVSEARRADFGGCRYFEYDAAARVLADVLPLPPEQREIVTSTGVSYFFTRFARAAFELYAATCSTRSRAQTSARRAPGSSSTSTSPTTRPARTTLAGSARLRRQTTGSRCTSRRASKRRRGGKAPPRGAPCPTERLLRARREERSGRRPARCSRRRRARSPRARARSRSLPRSQARIRRH